MEEDVSVGSPKPWHEEGVGSFGSWLRQQREIRNISLREISDSTKIGMRYLEALEEDRFEVLPAGVFAKGFLREYARYVGLDDDEVVNFYLSAERERRGGLEDPLAVHEPVLDPAATTPEHDLRKWLLVGGATLALVVLIAWYLLARRAGEAEQEPLPIAPPVAETPMAPAEPPPAGTPTSAPLVVTAGFTAECWIEAIVDGEERISELRVQGESMRIEAEREVRFLTIGNASAVRLEVNGRPYSLNGAAGEVLRDIVIGLEDAGIDPRPPGADTATPARRAGADQGRP